MPPHSTRKLPPLCKPAALTQPIDPGAVDPDAPLTCSELAALIGARRAGRPTRQETVRGWMLQGLGGVLLENEWDVGRRVTTWRKWLAFKAAVAAAHEEARKRLRDAVRDAVGSVKRQQAAQRKLERMGAR